MFNFHYVIGYFAWNKNLTQPPLASNKVRLKLNLQWPYYGAKQMKLGGQAPGIISFYENM